MTRKHSYEYIKNEVEKWGCVLLSSSYEGAKKDLQIQCKCGKEFPRKFKPGRSFLCRSCSHTRKWSETNANKLKVIREHVLEKWQGECYGVLICQKKTGKKHNHSLKCCSETWKDNKTLCLWKCKEPEHAPFPSRWNNVQSINQWCPLCGVVRQAELRRVYTIEDLYQYAAERKGICHSKEYDNGNTNYDWECEKHHRFNSQWYSMSHRETWCEKCALACESCGMWRITIGKLCVYCKNQGPKNKPYTKIKEYAVAKFLKTRFPDNNFTHNKSVGTECTGGHLFPDILYRCVLSSSNDKESFQPYVLIVEVDENRHRGSSYSCDKQRMVDIVAKLMVPCIFIRYNPDGEESSLDTLAFWVDKYMYLDAPAWGETTALKAKYLFY